MSCSIFRLLDLISEVLRDGRFPLSPQLSKHDILYYFSVDGIYFRSNPRLTLPLPPQLQC